MSYQLNKKENYKFCRLDYAVYTKGRVSLQHILCGLCTLIISVELTKTNRDVKRTVFFSYVYTHFIDRRSFAKINNLQGVCRVLNRPYLSLTHLNSALLTCWNLTWINSRHFEHSNELRIIYAQRLFYVRFEWNKPLLRCGLCLRRGGGITSLYCIGNCCLFVLFKKQMFP